MSYFTTNLQYLREKSGLTENVFAAAFDISIETLQKLENGIADPGIGLLLTLSRLFNCSLDTLVGKDLSLVTEENTAFSCKLLALDIDGVLTDGGMY